jgi:hypothetical protein
MATFNVKRVRALTEQIKQARAVIDTVSPKLAEEILAMHEAGMSDEQISWFTPYSRNGVSKIVARNRLPNVLSSKHGEQRAEQPERG